MSRTATRRALALAATSALAGASLLAAPAALADDGDGDGLWVDNRSIIKQHVAELHLKGQARQDALTLAGYPSANWFTGGSPKEVRNAVHNVVRRADDAGGIPTLVAYNVPFRDCAQYSAGGATSQAECEAWIDGFAAGIGDDDAIVILEPDGLGIIPFYTTVDGVQEWCQPVEADPATAAAERFEMLNHAVDVLSALPATKVYLDAGHPGWLNVGDITHRLLRAGVEKAAGFFLNASNYQFTENSVAYGRWISSCIAVVMHGFGGYGDCGNQYWNGGPANNWSGVAMTQYEPWTSDPAAPPEISTAGVDSRYTLQLGDRVCTVIGVSPDQEEHC